METVFEPTGWHWLVLGAALVALEVIAPGVFLLWLGLAALAVGSLVLVLPDITWPYQLLLFTLASLALVLAVRHFLLRHPVLGEPSTLNRRGEQYLGRVFAVESPIVNGYGRIRVGDGTWRVTGREDSEVGSLVKVTGMAGSVLVVERVQPLVKPESAPCAAKSE